MPQTDKNAPTALTGAQAIAAVIAEQEHPLVLGMPGGYTMNIWDALYDQRDRVETRLVRQESIATVMAEATGRLTGRPAFVIAQGAWVLGNAGVGIMEAHLGASPVVILIDATDGGAYSHLGPYQAGHGGYGAYDLSAAMTAISKRTFVARDAAQALQLTQLAIKHATTGEPGPVVVIFERRALVQRLDPRTQPPTYIERSYAVPSTPPAAADAIFRAAELIRASARPVIIAGNGVRLSQAETQLASFAEATGIPVSTTPAGKGVFDERGDLAAGVIGPFGHETGNATVGQADLILAVGTKLGATDTLNEHPELIDVGRQRLVQIDLEPLNASWTFPADHVIIGDAADALGRLRAALEGFVVDGRTRVAEVRVRHPYFDRPSVSEASDLSARDVVAELSRLSPERTVLTCDAGENRLFVLREFASKAGGTVLQPNGGGGMGYAIPAAMAAAMAKPEHRAIAVCGDGGFSMSLHSLISAVELQLTLTVVVLNNAVLGWVYNGQRGRYIASELVSFDYDRIAAAIGAYAVAVATLDEAREEIAAALDRPGVSVIVADVRKDDRYQDVMSPLNRDDVYAVPENR
ncbi:MAG: thiamine pyrophosphate-binding protein [Microbacterium sp.]